MVEAQINIDKHLKTEQITLNWRGWGVSTLNFGVFNLRGGVV